MAVYFMSCHNKELRVKYPLMNVDIKELFHCPYCGSSNFLTIDYSRENKQDFVNDCEICCKPMFINIVLEENIVCINVEKENK